MLRYAISDGRLALEHQSRLPAELAHQAPQVSLQDWKQPESKSAASATAADLLLVQAQSLATQQVDFFLIREPGLPARQLASLTRKILAILTGTPTRLLLHSRPDAAVATRSHGVHLPSTPETLTPNQVRTVYAAAGLPPPTVSLSCHTVAEILRACDLQPDLILFGPVFGKTVANKLVTPPTGLQALRNACDEARPIPVLALGGVTDANTSACLHAGAAGIAAIRMFNDSKS